MKPFKKIKTIQSIDRAVAIMEGIGASKTGMSLSAISQELALNAQTAQSIIRTLEHHGFIFQPKKGGSYWLGARFRTMALAWESQNPKITAAQKIMEKLAGRLNEYLILAALEKNRLNALIEFQSQQLLRINSLLPGNNRLHVSATGKILLAYLNETERESLLRDYSFSKVGPNSVTSKNALIRQLVRIKEKGVAVCHNETELGVSAIAVPVSDEKGNVHAALGTFVPTARLTEKTEKANLKLLQDTAFEIQQTWAGNAIR